jgi:hypothetical protein
MPWVDDMIERDGSIVSTTPATLRWILRVAVAALLLIGHGGFDFAVGKNWTSYGAAVGIDPTTLAAHPLSPMVGGFECVLGLIVLAWPMRGRAALRLRVEARDRGLPTAGR